MESKKDTISEKEEMRETFRAKREERPRKREEEERK